MKRIKFLYLSIIVGVAMTTGMVLSQLSASRITFSNEGISNKIDLVPLTSAANIRSADEVPSEPVTKSQPMPDETLPQSTQAQTSEPKVKAVTHQTESAPKAVATPTPKKTCGGAYAEQFLCLLNNYRESKGLVQLSGNSNLSKVALAHSTWMNETGTFSHTGINNSRLGERCSVAGITCRAENLAHNIQSAQQLLDMWVASPSHNKNLLGGYTTAGLGIYGNYITLLMN